ncbi:EAL domain-containing protein [Sphingorhabdus sp.]|uniref:EAL domain-containing protein n=1 Tax=Sphingorhabdus sp. TaxID=1902408 RepID=UPI00391A7042
MALNLNKVKIGRRILLFAVICGVLGALNFFQPLALALYAVQTKAAIKPVSGDVVVVGIDSHSISAIGRWPWPRDKQAELLRKIDAYDPAAIYVDIGYQGETTPLADNALRNTLESTKAPTKVVAMATAGESGIARTIFSHTSAVGSTENVSAHAPYLFGYIWELPTSVETPRGRLQSAAVSIAAAKEVKPQNFAIDYTFDPASIPTFSANDVFEGKLDKQLLSGKTVVLGATDPTQNDIHSMPGWGEQPGVFFIVLGAETLKSGIPKVLGWIYFFVLALVVCAFQLTPRGLKYSKHASWAGAAVMLGASTWLATQNIGNDPVPALALVASVGIFVSRQKAALIRSQRHATTGLFNMAGYMVDEVVSNAVFIGATLTRTDTRLGYVRQDDETAILKEVGHRLSTVIDEQQITHNDNQQFLWEMPGIPTSQLADHLEGLRQLFAEPLLIHGRKIDVDINFGVDRNVNRNVNSRMESALAASVEASKSQATFIISTTVEFDAWLTSRFGDEFETAVKNGDIELVLEPERSLNSGQVGSAAASLRWTHPAYGQIDTAKLFLTARETGHMSDVSYHLCKQAILYAGHLVKERSDFGISFNISVDVILNQNFGLEMLKAASEAKCPPTNVTMVIIDMHAHKFNEQARQAIHDLQQLGFRIGIGNFGMTDADIDFIKKFEPDEIVLAKSFSAELLGSTSNAIFAVGALRIATASGVISIADGIDDRDVLSALERHDCSRARGKIIAMPMNFQAFMQNYLSRADRKLG